MVFIVFKTVYFFLVPFALPQVLAAPGTALLANRAPFPLPDWITREGLLAHNDIRSKHKLPHLTWSDWYSIVAATYASKCKEEKVDYYENIARATSIPEAVNIWSSPLNEGLILLTNDKSIKKVGCAIPDCLNIQLVVCVYGG